MRTLDMCYALDMLPFGNKNGDLYHIEFTEGKHIEFYKVKYIDKYSSFMIVKTDA